MAKQKPKDPAEESALKLAEDILGTGLTRLDKHITKNADVEMTNTEASELAQIMTKIAQVSGELRKAKLAESKINADVGLKQFVEWVRRASPSEKKQAIRAIHDADADAARSGLA